MKRSRGTLGLIWAKESKSCQSDTFDLIYKSSPVDFPFFLFLYEILGEDFVMGPFLLPMKFAPISCTTERISVSNHTWRGTATNTAMSLLALSRSLTSPALVGPARLSVQPAVSGARWYGKRKQYGYEEGHDLKNEVRKENFWRKRNPPRFGQWRNCIVWACFTKYTSVKQRRQDC